MTMSIRVLFGAALVAAVAGCSSSHTMDAGGGDGPITYWLAPNGSEAVLKLDPVEPTTGF